MNLGRSTLQAGLVAAAIWIASCLLYVGYIGPRVGVAVFAGQIEISFETGELGGMPFNYAGREGFNAGVNIGMHLLLEVYLPNAALHATRAVAYFPVWTLIPLAMVVASRRGKRLPSRARSVKEG
jgi:hypothetical protein